MNGKTWNQNLTSPWPFTDSGDDFMGVQLDFIKTCHFIYFSLNKFRIQSTLTITISRAKKKQDYSAYHLNFCDNQIE